MLISIVYYLFQKKGDLEVGCILNLVPITQRRAKLQELSI